MNLPFLLFVGLGVLLALNGLRALIRSSQGSRKRGAKQANDLMNGVVSLLAAGGIVFAAFYMFRF